MDRSYTPGTHKLIQHLDHLGRMKAKEVVAPIHISIWPTIRCQSACAYCCCKDEDRTRPDLSWEDFTKAVDALWTYGTKALEFAGGGEPTLWPLFSKGVRYAKILGLKVSLITNGIDIERVPKETLELFDWIRFSLQSVEHAKIINFDHVPEGVRYSASFMIDTIESIQDLKPIHDFVKGRGLLTRIALTQPSDPSADDIGRLIVKRFGDPFFFAQKERGTPAGCFMAWIRAAVDWRGYFLPCPAVMLVPGSGGAVKDSFRLCHVRDLEKWLQDNRVKDLGFRCGFCNCGKEHNDFVYDLVQEVSDADFV